MKTLLSAVVGVALALATVAASADGKPGTRQVSLAIDSTTLAGALDQWAQQSGYQIIGQSWDVAEKLAAPKLKGTYSAQEALEKLLSDTPLTHRWVSEKAVAIRPRGKASSSTQGSSPSSRLRLAELSNDAERSSSASVTRRDVSVQSDIARAALLSQLDLEEIIVTGSHIRGARQVGGSVIVMDRQYIEQSGFAAVPDLFKSLPQNFRGGVSESFNTDQNAQNLNGGTALDLRGLGASSTLVLVDGRRLAAGGLSGAFTDVSGIASAAIERVEILTDGASAVYGSDAVGGVVNFILRKDYEGAETRVRFGKLGGDANETVVSQLLGTRWDGGNILGGYQFYKRESLGKSEFPNSASDDLRRFGGDDFRSTFSNPGNILDLFGSAQYAIPPGQDGRSLTVGELLPGAVNLHDSAAHADLLPQQKTHSVFVHAAQDVSDGVELFLDATGSQRDMITRQGGLPAQLPVPASNAFFPDGLAAPFIVVPYNFVEDFGPQTGISRTTNYSVAGGASFALPGAWLLRATGAYGAEDTRYKNLNIVNQTTFFSALADPNPATAFNPFGDGSNTAPATLELMRGRQLNRAETDVRSVDLVVDGPLFAAPGGKAKVAVGGHFRTENLGMSLDSTGVPTLSSADIDRDVSAAFGEITIPLVTAQNAAAGVHELVVSAAGRYEDYSDFGSSFNPKLGLTWAPIESLVVRGTWGESFRAPRLADLITSPDGSLANAAFVSPAPDPLAPGGMSLVLFQFGNNADLRPETAKSWTAGLDWTPLAVEGLQLSATYFDITYRDRISPGGPPGNQFSVLLQEDVWAEVITRNPSQAQIDAICASPQFLPGGDCSAPIAAIADLRLLNLASVDVQGVDLLARYSVDTSRGTWQFELNGSRALHFERTVTSNAPRVDLADTVGNLPSLRARGRAAWTLQNLTAAAMVNYTDGLIDDISQPQREIGSWTTFDLAFIYRMQGAVDLLRNLEIGFNAVNVFDKAPPFANVRLFGYDAANADPFGRLLSVRLTKQW
jgi:iron complex outermembrane recepter protein